MRVKNRVKNRVMERVVNSARNRVCVNVQYSVGFLTNKILNIRSKPNIRFLPNIRIIGKIGWVFRKK